MNEEKQAARLARWLDAPPGSVGLPDDLDDDLVEAITALRPDLAPGPRLTADEILASLEQGPLAAGWSAVASSSQIGAPEPANRPSVPGARWWKAVGGLGGLGVVLAAAASLLVVVRADLARAPAEVSGAAPAVALAPQATEQDAPVGAEAAAPQLAKAAEKQVTARAASTTTGRAPAAAERGEAAPEEPLPPAVARNSAVLDDAVADADLSAKPKQSPAAEKAADAAVLEEDLSRYQAQVGGAGADGWAAAADSAPSGAAAGPLPSVAGTIAYDEESSLKRDSRDKKESRKTPATATEGRAAQAPAAEPDAAVPQPAPAAPPPPPADQMISAPDAGWSTGLDGQTRVRFDAARTRATALAAGGDPAAAATALSAVIGQPARAGQYHAALAARYWISAGFPERAAAVCRQGLALSSEPTPERQVLLGVLASLPADPAPAR